MLETGIRVKMMAKIPAVMSQGSRRVMIVRMGHPFAVM
jgi:hypothetical protein